MLLTYANALAYLCLAVALGLVLGSAVLAVVAGCLIACMRDVLLILGQPDILED